MFDMWSSVTSKLEAQTQIQTNIQQTQLQNSSSGSIKVMRVVFYCKSPLMSPKVWPITSISHKSST
ncbi:CLUMA_CG017124, isoform A [Clunio marinus]|uniref:CLUMA_CG017124, isoform A n=1 Tax=Clunio marinus TaxID=568069 RepID=A0A1J1IXX7_9DIPT|nr:CLUMA_CG017124, isoform A [Clunio marinus]